MPIFDLCRPSGALSSDAGHVPTTVVVGYCYIVTP
jgi:hypothetical protein